MTAAATPMSTEAGSLKEEGKEKGKKSDLEVSTLRRRARSTDPTKPAAAVIATRPAIAMKRN